MAYTSKTSFFDMSKWAIVGGILGILIGWIADEMGFIANPIAEGVVRLTSGTMDTIAELFFINLATQGSVAKKYVRPYVYGTLIGTVFAPLSHVFIRSLGVDPYGVWGLVYAFAYSNSDNFFGTVTYLVWQIKGNGFAKGYKKFISEPFMVGNIIALVIILILDLMARLNGFSPIRNIVIGVEAALMDADTIIAAGFSVMIYKLNGVKPRGK